MATKEGLQGREVVVGSRKGIRRRRLGDAGAVRQAEGGHTRARMDEEKVRVAVVAAFELHYPVPPRECAGEPQGRHRRLGAGVDEAEHLQVRHEPLYEAGELQLEGAGCAEARTAEDGLGEGLRYAPVGMAQDEGPPREDVVDEAVPVDVVEPGPIAALDEEGLSSYRLEGADGGTDAARH